MIQLAKRTFREEIKHDWSCGKNMWRIQLLRWTQNQSALKVSTGVGSRLCGSKTAMTCDRVVSDLMLLLWKDVLWPSLDAWDSVRLRTTSTQWNVPGWYGPCGEFFSIFLTEEPLVLRELVRVEPSIPIEAVEACALVGLHMMAEEDSRRMDSGSSFSSSSSSENNVVNGALFVIGLHGSGDAIALFLQDWEVAKVVLNCHIALDMLCQELYEVERRRGWFGFWTSLSVERQALVAGLPESLKFCFSEHFGCSVMRAIPSSCWPLCFVRVVGRERRHVLPLQELEAEDISKCRSLLFASVCVALFTVIHSLALVVL